MTGYRAFSFTFVKTYPVLSRGFEVETEMTIHSLNNNLRLFEMPIQYRDRPEGSVSKLDTVGDGIKVMSTIFRMIREYKATAVLRRTWRHPRHHRHRAVRQRDRGLLAHWRGGAIPHAYRRGHARHCRTAIVHHRHHPRCHGQERPQSIHHRRQSIRHDAAPEIAQIPNMAESKKILVLSHILLVNLSAISPTFGHSCHLRHTAAHWHHSR